MTDKAVSPEEYRAQIARARKPFAAMVGTYCLGAMNDNFFKQAGCLIAITVGFEQLQGLGGLVFTLPWLLFASQAGWLADRYPKRNIIIASKLLELVAMLIGAAGILTTNWYLFMTMLFIMATQSTIFSPALNGSIPELYPRSYVIKANSVVKMIVTACNLVGIIAAGFALGSDGFGLIPFAEPGRWVVAILIVTVALIGLVLSFFVPHKKAADPDAKFPARAVWDTIARLAKIKKDKLLWAVLMLDACVWLVAILQILIINDLAKNHYGLADSQTSFLLIPELLGVAVGGILAGKIAAGPLWFKPVTKIFILLAVATAAISGVGILPNSAELIATCALLAVAGIAGGILLVPLESFFQIRPADTEKGAVIAAGNFTGFVGMAIASVIYMLIADNIPQPAMFLIVSAVSLAAAFYAARVFRNNPECRAALAQAVVASKG